MPLQVSLIGSGNWGSAIARIIGKNVLTSNVFHATIPMWVYEELLPDHKNAKLSAIINTTHENVKYLPGYKLPENIFAQPDLKLAVQDADILIFCIPHQFLPRILLQLSDIGIKRSAMAISLIKGIDFDENGMISLLSKRIRETLGIDCSVLMGANVANEVARGDFCEATLGCSNLRHGAILQELFHTNNFHIDVVLDPHGVELCGALKNIVALGAGYCDGLNLGSNTKAAIIRIGLVEMKRFCFRYFDGIKEDTFFASCGIADLITTCFGGRNRKCAAQFVALKLIGQKNVTWELIENEMLQGQKLQGPDTCKELQLILRKDNVEDLFPLFTTIYNIAFQNAPPETITQFNEDHVRSKY